METNETNPETAQATELPAEFTLEGRETIMNGATKYVRCTFADYVSYKLELGMSISDWLPYITDFALPLYSQSDLKLIFERKVEILFDRMKTAYYENLKTNQDNSDLKKSDFIDIQIETCDEAINPKAITNAMGEDIIPDYNNRKKITKSYIDSTMDFSKCRTKEVSFIAYWKYFLWLKKELNGAKSPEPELDAQATEATKKRKGKKPESEPNKPTFKLKK